MTNLLFNDNVKGVFSFPQEVEDILDKMPVEKNKRVEVAKKELDLDDARKIEQSKQTKINENTGSFGVKKDIPLKYRTCGRQCTKCRDTRGNTRDPA